MHAARPFLPVLLAVAAAGCGSNQFIQPNTDKGKTAYLFLGSDESLQEQGRISAHRRFRMIDETEIDTWILRSEQEKGTVVVLHGLGESKANYLSVGENLVKRGYDVVLPDLRRHGRSGGQYVTHGIKEKFDVSSIVDRLIREGSVDPPIYVAGVNLGAVVALQYAAVNQNRVKGVMAVDPYTDLESYVEYTMRLLPEKDRRETMDEIQSRASFRVADASAVNAIRQLRVPVLLAYGVIDVSVPPGHARKLYEQAEGPKDIVYVEPLSLALTWPEWMARQIDRLATTKLQDPGQQ